MTISDRELITGLSQEKKLIDQTLSVALLAYFQIMSETSESNNDLGLPTSQYLGRFGSAVINVIRYGDLKARIEETTIEDPETAWVKVVRDHTKKLGSYLIDMRKLERDRLFSPNSADLQRELYQEMRAIFPDDDVDAWDRAAVKPTTGPIV
jgi:hypothetical protein